MKKANIFKFYESNFSLNFFVILLFCMVSLSSGFCKGREESGKLQYSLSKSYLSKNEKPQKSLEEIDKEINELEDMKRGYEAKALKHNNQAELFQFREGELQRAKRHWKLAEYNRKIARRIQMQIDVLKIQRIDLLKKRR